MSARRLELLLAVLGAAAILLAAAATPWLKFVLTIALAKGIAVVGPTIKVELGVQAVLEQ